MDETSQELVNFQGIRPKPPSPPDWLRLLRHSQDFGEWRMRDEQDEPTLKKKKGRKKNGKK